MPLAKLLAVWRVVSSPMSDQPKFWDGARSQSVTSATIRRLLPHVTYPGSSAVA